MSVLICPICQNPLVREGNNLCCPARHSFDFAREGYVHLLPSNKMHAKVPGDNAAMAQARHRFLAMGHYDLFIDGVSGLLARTLSDAHRPVVLDAGCGEGTYTAAVARCVRGAQVCGIDISKAAVRLAAKRPESVEWAVASCFGLPIGAGVADAVLSVFSPIVPEEFMRVTRLGGVLLLAVPSARHLFGLKQVLYEHPYENETRDTAYPGFVFVQRVPLRGEVIIEGQQAVSDLFAMTPYYWKTGREGVARLAACSRLQTELGFDLLLYRREEIG